MGEQLSVEGIRSLLGKVYRMSGERTCLLRDVRYRAGMVSAERMAKVVFPDGEHARQAGKRKHCSKQDDEH